MVRRRTRSLAVALTTGALTAGAVCAGAFAAPAAAQSYAREASVGLESAYVFRGVQLAETTATANAEAILGPIYAGGRVFAPIGDDTDELAPEARLYAGLAPDIVLGLASFDVGAIAYVFLDDSAVLPDDERIEVYGGATLNVPFSPSLYLYYDFEAETASVIARGAQYVPIGGLRGLDLALDAGIVEPDDADGYSFAEARVDFVQGFGRGLEAYLGARAAVSSEDTFFDDLTAVGPVFGESGEVWGGGGLRLSF